MSKTLISLCYVSLVLAACAGRHGERQPSLEAVASPVQHVSPQPGIRSIDFANFTYPGDPVFQDGTKSFTLQNGRFKPEDDSGPVGLAYLAYGDATADGNEEAIIALNTSVKGSAIPYFVYIYSWQDQKPKLLWSFAAGDRADGGLRQAHAVAGELVIELYGKSKMIGKDLYAHDGKSGGACCPTHFTQVGINGAETPLYRKQSNKSCRTHPEARRS